MFAFFILASKLGIMWMVSVHRLFEMRTDNIASILVWILITLILDILLKYQLLVHYDYFKEKDPVKYVKSYWRDMILLAYFIAYPFHFGFHQ